ncbi:hypothetical protein QBC41DRAFT_299963 [Cercophora samala]|uniref:Uncharacterized protein n=1 Tax=Cercophora samala TaxID=330535 RepID=A0AA40DF59_9PEZI|nr:hypothetical protein QBC41DRAFT_299963 [Cercophora samala]
MRNPDDDDDHFGLLSPLIAHLTLTITLTLTLTWLAGITCTRLLPLARPRGARSVPFAEKM